MEHSIKRPDKGNEFIKLREVCLTRSGQKILDDLTLDIPGKGVTVLLGANGAGKSTLLKLLAGITAQQSGEVNVAAASTAFLMPEPAVFYPQLTVQEQLQLVAGLFNMKAVEQEIENLLSFWQLQTVKNKLTKHLSLGYRQRLSLAQLALSDADMMLLDEPMNGMDPKIMTVFKQQINQWKVSKSLIIATHIMHEAQELADWVVVMLQGKIIYSAAYQEKISFSEIYQRAISENASVHQEICL